MTKAAHLWAIGYDDVGLAEHARQAISTLGWGSGQGGKHLILLDIAVVVRHPDGSFTFDRQLLPKIANVAGSSAVGFLAGLVLGAPITGASIGAIVGSMGSALSAATVGIGADFVEEVERLMKPGTSALFVLDDQGDLDVILHTLRGLGGTILKTNVDLQRARLIQATLAAAAADASEPREGQSGG
jgi:uncharacterized membrane protein